jgi:hypothetical protein
MIETFQHYFGEYPFKKGSYKLSRRRIQVWNIKAQSLTKSLCEPDISNATGPASELVLTISSSFTSGHEWFKQRPAADASDM